jgi:hypothetical protein
MVRRIQLRRTKGWKKPEGVVTVSRPSVWGNPFDWREVSRDEAVSAYRRWIVSDDPDAVALRHRLPELRGRDLACWCPLDAPCHADVLLEMANR